MTDRDGTKGNPGLVADVLGDWREELVVRTADSTATASGSGDGGEPTYAVPDAAQTCRR